MASDRAQILITAVDQTRAALNSAKANLERLAGAASKVNAVMASLGLALSAGALAAAGKAALDTADELSKLAQKTGISVESLSLLKPIAEQSGVSLEGLAKGLQKLATSMFDAASGLREPKEAFAQLGVAFRDGAGQLRPTEAVLLDLADAFAAMPDGAQKSALAMKLFGKSGVELIPFLNQGRAGIEQLKDQFKALGLELSTDTAKAAEKFNDTLDTVGQALKGVGYKVAEAALPALQQLADALVALAGHGAQIMSVLRTLGELLLAVLAVKGVASAGKLLVAVDLVRAALSRFLPVLLAVAAFEVGKSLLKTAQYVREANRAMDEMTRQREQVRQLNAAMDELARTGTLSVQAKMLLAAHAAERLRAALPGAGDALRGVEGAARQTGQAIAQALESELKRASETVKQLSASYRLVAADIKAIWSARVADIEANYKRQTQAAQTAARSEASAIGASAQTLLAAEREKLAAVEDGARQMEAAWRTSYGQAVTLARAAGQDVQAIERQALDARIAIYSQMESAYRATVDRLIGEEQRHLQAAKAADEARLNLRLSVEDRIRELSRKGMDEYAAYQDRLRQIDEKQAQARAALAAGNFEQARKLAEESIALAERSASSVTRQVEQDGKTITQTVVSDATAAANAIGQIKESAGIADAALEALGQAHKQAAQAAGSGADEARQALAGVSSELEKLRGQLLSQDKLTLEVDIDAAKVGIERIKALTQAQQLVTTIELDTKQAQAALEKLKTDTDNLSLVASVQADTAKVMADIDQLKSTLASANMDIATVVSFEQPRAQLASFAQDAQAVLSAPTVAMHTPFLNLTQYHVALGELQSPTSSTHTIYVRKVSTNALGGLIQKMAQGGQAIAQGFARIAGRVVGPGTESSDSVPAMLSHGEFVIRAASVRKFGEGFFAALNAGFAPALPRFAVGGLASGAVAQIAMDARAPSASNHDVVDLRFHVGEKTHTVQSSRQTAMQLAQALRELSRGQ